MKRENVPTTAEHTILRRLATNESAERAALIAGLRAAQASVSPKYLYDELGCALYGAICQTPEYYPTRTEIAIFQQHRADIAAAIGTGKQFVDLGAGDCCKAESWLPFLRPTRYIAVDIAGPEIDRALSKLAPDFPEVEMVGVITDFSQMLDLDGVLADHAATFFYPGSSIGNFTPDGAAEFLGQIIGYCRQAPGSGLLIGVDCKKEKARLDAAYDDELGVTAAFNRNVLLHINKLVGGDFDIRYWKHRGFYNEALGRIEMHLESIRDQTVIIDGVPRPFAAGERIHTESSYKYHPHEFEAMLKTVGFHSVQRWQSEGECYAVFYAKIA